MVKTILVSIASALTLTSYGDVICSGSSELVAIDSRVDVEPVVDSVEVAWDAAWIGGDVNATVVISDNGTEVKCTTGVGNFAYVPTGIGRHKLTYTTYIDNVAQDEVYVVTFYSGWKYEVVDGGAVITETTRKVGDVNIPFEIDGYTVIGIANGTFSYCAELISVTIPEGVTSIVDYAFAGCDALVDMRIPDSVTDIGASAFSGCSALTNVTIGGGVRRIDADAFQGCNGLSAVHISDLSAWCGIAFGNSDANPLSHAHKLYLNGDLVSDLVIPDDVTVVCDYAFYGCDEFSSVTMHDDVLRIDSYALAGCSGLEEIVVPDSVTNIGSGCFARCTNLVSMTLPFVGSQRANSDLDGRFGFIFGVTASDGLTEVGSRYIPSSLRKVVITDETVVSRSAFDQCAMLTDIELNEGIRDIGQWAFAWCNLTNMIIPNSVTNVGMGVFACCGKLESLTLPFVGSRRGNTGTRDSLFGYVLGDSSYAGGVSTRQYYSSSSYSIFYIPSSLHSVILTDETVLGYGAFYGCSGLTNVTVSYGVTDIGIYAFRDCSGLTSIAIPDSVTSIGNRAFYGCSGLASMELPFVGSERGNSGDGGSLFGYIFGIASYDGSVAAIQYCSDDPSSCRTNYVPVLLKSVVITDETVLGYGAFGGCDRLESITVPAGVTAIGDAGFSGCSNLMCITIPDGVTSIGDYAFYGCGGLSSIMIPDGVEYIGEHAFDGCDGLSYSEDGYIIINGWLLGYSNPEVTSLVIPDGVVGIGSSAFADFWNLEEVVFPDSLRYIGGGAFDTCTGLDNVVIPDGVEIIGDSAFRNCTYMRNITIGEGVEAIGDEAFANCTQLSSLSIPDNVTEIGNAAFSNCWRMLSVRLPLGLESVGVNMFSGCTSLTGVTVPTHAFTMKRIFGDRYTALTSVSVSSGETKVCDGAFAGCSALTSVVMPNAITDIGNSAFASCSHLAGLELPESLDVIGAGAFSNCTALAAIVLPDEVTTIGQRAFYGCTSLANATLSRSLSAIPNYAFHGCSKLSSMVVPASVSSLGAYIGNYFSSLYYLGNAPSYDANVYASRARTITTYVVQGSRGWDGIPSSRDLPTSWNGYDITFWEPNRFDATFNANSGTFFDASNAYACEQITDTAYALPPYEPTLEGFIFDGWWTDPYEGAEIKATTRVNETRDITFYAHWKGAPSAITVRFNANGGTVVPDEGQYYSTLTYETLPVPTREHYKFAGWWTKAVGGNKVVASSRVPTADQELFAHWTPETYTIRYNANGGTGTMLDQSFVYGSTVVLMTNRFSRVDKNFVGWAVTSDGAVVYPDGGSLGSVAAIENGIISLYAVWRGNSYVVRFDSNGGIGSMDNATFEMDEQRALPACVFTRDGFDFAGWATSPEGEPVYSDGAVVSALTSEVNGSFVLYAVWRAFTVEAPVVTPGDGSVFVGDSCEVSITCATAGAAIYYSTTGKAPKLTDKNRYIGAFSITNTTTIYAVAVRGETTAYSVVTISKQELTLQYVLGDGGKVTVTTSTDFPWEPVADNGAAIGYSARSALPTEDDMDSWVELSVAGSGTLSFKCRTSCEWDYTGGRDFDSLRMATNGVEIVEMRLDGIQGDWTSRAVAFSEGGEHKIRLTYHKDEEDFDGEDCAWLGDVIWTPAGAAAPIPAVAVDADTATVNAAVDGVGFADAAVKVAIGGSAAEYNAFKTWADGVKGVTGDALAGEAAVVANAHAAAAYLLGAERLFENEPTIEIGELAIVDGESAGTTTMTVAVTVKDGASAVAVSAAKVAAMFEATGDLGDWTGSARLTPKVDISGTDASGKMTFVVTPGDGTANRAFLRIKR